MQIQALMVKSIIYEQINEMIFFANTVPVKQCNKNAYQYLFTKFLLINSNKKHAGRIGFQSSLGELYDIKHKIPYPSMNY